MAKKMAMGKGIASLLNNTPQQILAQDLKEDKTAPIGAKGNKNILEQGPLMVAVSEISPNASQPRKIFKEKELDELAISIKENGILLPLIVAKNEGEKGFELIAGERRLRAAKRAGIDMVPVIVKRATARDKMVYAIIENVQRSDLNCVEEALAYFRLTDEYKLTQEEVAKKLGKERSTVANFLRILKLPRIVIEMLQKELLSFGHAKVLAAIKDREKAIRLANTTVEEQLSVRELEKLSKKSGKIASEKKKSDFYGERLEEFRDKLERNTGFHFAIKDKKNGAGDITIKFSNEAEFNDIYEYLLK